jgi:hypothetical protein
MKLLTVLDKKHSQKPAAPFVRTTVTVTAKNLPAKTRNNEFSLSAT